MSTIVQQAVRWLEKIGIGVEYNAELQEFEFEYKDALVIINTDTPKGVISFTCPYMFPDELSNENKVVFQKAKEWWTKYINTAHCFCEFVDNDCAYICCLYGHNRKDALRKYELIEELEDTIFKWKLFIIAISSSFNNQLSVKHNKKYNNEHHTIPKPHQNNC
jgi:hypothetical protein